MENSDGHEESPPRKVRKKGGRGMGTRSMGTRSRPSTSKASEESGPSVSEKAEKVVAEESVAPGEPPMPEPVGPAVPDGGDGDGWDQELLDDELLALLDQPDSQPDQEPPKAPQEAKQPEAGSSKEPEPGPSEKPKPTESPLSEEAIGQIRLLLSRYKGRRLASVLTERREALIAAMEERAAASDDPDGLRQAAVQSAKESLEEAKADKIALDELSAKVAAEETKAKAAVKAKGPLVHRLQLQKTEALQRSQAFADEASALMVCFYLDRFTEI